MISRLGSLVLGALIISATPVEAAENYTIQTPVLGHVFDRETGTLHRVAGIPGASWIGDAIELDLVLSEAYIAPSQKYAIVRDDQGRALVVDLDAQAIKVSEIEGVLEGANGVMISPTARHAALYSTVTGEVQLLAGLPENPSVSKILQLDRSERNWTALAISDHGVIVAAAARAESGSLYMLQAGRSPERIGAVQRVGEIAFFAGSNDVVVTDTAGDEILLYRDVVARRQSSVIASANDGVRNPFGAKPTADGRFVVVGLAGGSIASIPLFGGAPVFTDCACATTSLTPMTGGNVFRLTDDISEPLQIAEVGAASRVLFIPARQQTDASDR